MSALRRNLAPEDRMPRLLRGIRRDGHPMTLDQHLAGNGAHPLDGTEHGRTGLIRLIADSGLTGRGGAGFPTARKLEAVGSGKRRAVVVANGTEGEPVSRKDTVLLSRVPHLVIDGAVLAAHAVGARTVVLAAGTGVQATLEHALAERRRAGVDGHVEIRRVTTPDRFLAGEETALVHLLNGGPAIPTATPPRPYERGVGGAPTLVQNVETLAHLALIARFGADWFRRAGTPAEPGSVLVTLSGAVRRPGVIEVPLGISLADLVQSAGGATAEIEAILVGGYFGTWVDAREGLLARLTTADLGRLGAAPGARAIVALPAGACGLRETARVARYLASESAGQCGPCVHGLAAVADDLGALVDGSHSPRDRERLERRLAVVAGRGACHHPDGAVRFIASGLRVFHHEIDAHVRRGPCPPRSGSVLPLPKARAA